MFDIGGDSSDGEIVSADEELPVEMEVQAAVPPWEPPAKLLESLNVIRGKIEAFRLEQVQTCVKPKKGREWKAHTRAMLAEQQGHCDAIKKALFAHGGCACGDDKDKARNAVVSILAFGALTVCLAVGTQGG